MHKLTFFTILISCWTHASAYESLFSFPKPNYGRALATSGASGGLNTPDGHVLADGAVIIGFNNSLDPQFSSHARGDNYQFAMGLFPYLEFSGRLANFPLDNNGTLGIRDLSANIKVGLPKLFRYQPNVALGINDLAGGAPFFKSKYIAVSDTYGPLSLTVGVASGERYIGRHFAAAAWNFANTGLSVLLESNGGAASGGVRYTSREFRSLNNANIIFTAQRTYGSRGQDGFKYQHGSLGLNLQIPLEQSQSRSRKLDPALEPMWIQPEGFEDRLPAGTRVVSTDQQAMLVINPTETASSAVDSVTAASEPLGRVRTVLAKAGLERVRVGIRQDELVVEFENHRYNQNEVDAIGIALGAGVLYSPDKLKRVTVVVKKAGLALYSVSVERGAYRSFLATSTLDREQIALAFQFRPSQLDSVQWENAVESERGWSRFRIEPSLNKFVGTDVGVFDYSLAANLQGFVPLWKGAEIVTSYFSSLDESKNVAHGIFGFAQQRSGLKSAVLSQSFWLADRVLGVANVGKFMYDDKGIQLETVYFVHGREDQLKLKYTHLRHPEGGSGFSGAGGAYSLGSFQSSASTSAGALSYLWSYQPLNISVDASYNRYIGTDRGPTIQVNRWFGDVQAQVFMRRSNLETKIGFGLAFPLTPRRGMNFGWTHVEGSGSYPLRLETRYAREGQCNCITNGIVQEMPMVYSSSVNLLNQGRIGREYLLSQLQRMREAAFIYANLAL